MLDRSLRPAEAGAGAAGPGEVRGNVDRVLFKDLVDMVPLVESLMVSACVRAWARRAAAQISPGLEGFHAPSRGACRFGLF